MVHVLVQSYHKEYPINKDIESSVMHRIYPVVQ